MNNMTVLGAVPAAAPGALAKTPGEHKHDGKPSFLTRAAGPLKVWQWSLVGLGVAGAATGVTMFLRRRKHK